MEKRIVLPEVGSQELDRERLRTVLHDGLGQSLTSISFLAGSLRQTLAARALPEANQAAEILSLAGRAISEVQSLMQEGPAPGLERPAERKVG